MDFKNFAINAVTSEKSIKGFSYFLAATTFLTPTEAYALPVLAFVAGVATALGAPIILGAGAAYGAGITAGLFLTSTALGSLLVNLAISFALNALFAPSVTEASIPKPADLQANFTSDIPHRFFALSAGVYGGSVVFAQSKGGFLHKLVAVNDSELVQFNNYYLANVPVTLDADGDVETDQFLTKNGTKPFSIQHRNGTQISGTYTTLKDTYNEWTDDYVGAGVTDVLMVMETPSNSLRGKILRYQGALGLGEPDVLIGGVWGRNHDPRIEASIANNEETWPICNGNLALMVARHRMDKEAFNTPHDAINWEKMGIAANDCDVENLNRYGELVKTYQGSLLKNKNNERHIDCEDKLLAACDGKRHTDAQGRFFITVGKDEEPTIVITDDDILGGIESDSTKDGETEFTHLSVLYTEPNLQYREQASATYVDSNWQVGDKIRSKEIKIPCCTDHTQACRLAKIAMTRQNARYALAFSVGHIGAKLREERKVRLELNDPVLSGVYEVSTLNESSLGVYDIGLISYEENQSTLLEGEEGARPNFNISVTLDDELENIEPEDMNITTSQVPSSSGNSVRFVATFDEPDQNNKVVQIQQREKGSFFWIDYGVKTEDGFGNSDIISDGSNYEHRWRVTTINGSSSEWSDVIEVAAVADQTPPTDLSNITVTSTTGGEVEINWTTSDSSNYRLARIYRRATNIFDDSTNVRDEYGLPDTADSWTDEGLAAGDYYYWIVPVNGSGVQGTRDGSFQVTVA